MRNAMTQKQFDLIKKETYSFFVFTAGTRLLTYEGLSLLGAMQQQAIYQGPDRVTLIAHDSQIVGCSVENFIEDFQYLFDLKGGALTPKEVE